MIVPSRLRSLLIFVAVSILYVITRQLIFKGFNGTDDLHYAMLAARMVKGNYNPFEPTDIFSGRMLVIAIQAAVYRLGGISIWTTQFPSLLMVILSAVLTVFGLLEPKRPAYVFLCTCLFYFNPLLTFLSFGPLADLYVLFGGLLVCLSLQRWYTKGMSVYAGIVTGSLISLLVSLFLLFKETMIIFLPFGMLTALFLGRRRAMPLVGASILLFGACISGYALLYRHYTGDPFFKITQIMRSSYTNHCSYDLQPASQQLKRLTYEVFQEAINRGYYPLVFALMAFIFLLVKQTTRLKDDFAAVNFIILLLLALYFPFSFHGYQPLCSDTRQFLFLLPLSSILGTRFIIYCFKAKGAKNILFYGSVLVSGMCVLSTGNKWQWMIWLLISFCSGIVVIFHKLMRLIVFAALPFTLWTGLLEHLFFLNSNWFKQMKMLDSRISSRAYYFPDHDNMMHWQLLHGFDQEHLRFYVLCEHPFKVFDVYYQHLAGKPFEPGWFILNRKYTVLSPDLVNRFYLLKKQTLFVKQVDYGDVCAFYIDSPLGLAYLRSLMPACE